MMTRTLIAIGIACCCFLLLRASSQADAPPPGTLHFREHGFSIAPLAGHADGQAQQVVAMMQPAQNGYANTVTVMVQPFTGTIEAYLQVSKKSFEAKRVKVLAAKQLDATHFMMEYVGPISASDKHAYVMGVMPPPGGKVYLATGMTLASQWDAASAPIKACVDSLKLE